MNMQSQTGTGTLGHSAKHSSEKSVDVFCVLDLDRTLFDTEKSFRIFADAVHAVGFITNEEVYNAVIESGGAFDVLTYVRSTLRDKLDSTDENPDYVESIVEDIKNKFIELSENEDSLLPGALELLSRLDDDKVPYGILTHGGYEWQMLKLQVSGLNIPTYVTDYKEKGALMRNSWYRRSSGDFLLPKQYGIDGQRIIAKRLVLIDDKLVSFDDAPEEVFGVHIIGKLADIRRDDYRGKRVLAAAGLPQAIELMVEVGYLSGDRR